MKRRAPRPMQHPMQRSSQNNGPAPMPGPSPSPGPSYYWHRCPRYRWYDYDWYDHDYDYDWYDYEYDYDLYDYSDYNEAYNAGFKQGVKKAQRVSQGRHPEEPIVPPVEPTPTPGE